MVGLLECKIAGCKEGSKPSVLCCIPICTNTVHKECVKQFQKHKNFANFSFIVCGKHCYNVKVKEQKSDNTTKKANKPRQRFYQHNYSSESSQCKHSITLLLKWLSMEPNYQHYKGSSSIGGTGESRNTISTKISTYIKDNGIPIEQLPKEIQMKIYSLQNSYKKALHCLNNTGQGVNNKRDLKTVLVSKCIYWEILDMFMAESHTVYQLYTERVIEADINSEQTKDPTEINAMSISECNTDESSSSDLIPAFASFPEISDPINIDNSSVITTDIHIPPTASVTPTP